MKSSMKKVLVMVLALAMLTGTLTACGAGTATPSTQQPATEKVTSAAGETTSPGGTDTELEYAQDTSPFEFTVWWPSVWAWAKPAVEAGWDDSPVYKRITEKTGGKMIIDMPAGKEEELIGPLIASGDLPDVMVFNAFNNPYIPQMKDAGQIVAFGDLIDRYAPKMWSLIPKSQLQFHADKDGKLWKYVGFEYDTRCFEAFDELKVPRTHGYNIMFARKDILAAYGKQDITDLDDFTAFLKFCKEKYPEVDPLKLPADDPRTELFTHFKSTFGCHLSNTYPQQDGTLKFYWYDPAYVEYLQWLNGLFQQGLITTNMLTEGVQQKDEKMYGAKYGAIMSATYNAYNTLNETIKTNLGNDDKGYTAIGPIQKSGVKWEAAALRSKGSQATVITTNAKQPDRIIKFFEYLLTDEGQMVTNAGVEGDMWNTVDGKWVPDPDAAALAAKDLQSYVSRYKVNGPWSPWVKTYFWERYLGAVLTPEGLAKDENIKRLNAVRDIWEEGFADIEGAVDPGSDLDVLRTKINNLCKESGMKMIAAKDAAEFDKIYNDCKAQIEKLGVDKIEAVYTAEHRAQLKALGK